MTSKVVSLAMICLISSKWRMSPIAWLILCNKCSNSCIIQTTDEVVILEEPFEAHLAVGVHSLAVHAIAQPLALVVRLVRPGVDPLALSVATLEATLVLVTVSEQVHTYINK